MSNLTKAKAAMEAANNSSFAYNPFSSIQSGLTPSRKNMQDICKEIKAERKRQNSIGHSPDDHWDVDLNDIKKMLDAREHVEKNK